MMWFTPSCAPSCTMDSVAFSSTATLGCFSFSGGGQPVIANGRVYSWGYRGDGPHMEEQLEAEGVTLGHFPDSFVHSTLGGWVATRSAGMQSDKYGKIEDMVIALRMVTPSGTIVTRTVPNTSNGIDVRHLCVGSEGILGVITEVTMQVHRVPEYKMFEGWLFPDFESGIKAIHECMRHGVMPIITRLNDPGKTALSAAFKKGQPASACVGRQVGGDQNHLPLRQQGHHGAARGRRGQCAARGCSSGNRRQ